MPLKKEIVEKNLRLLCTAPGRFDCKINHLGVALSTRVLEMLEKDEKIKKGRTLNPFDLFSKYLNLCREKAKIVDKNTIAENGETWSLLVCCYTVYLDSFIQEGEPGFVEKHFKVHDSHDFRYFQDLTKTNLQKYGEKWKKQGISIGGGTEIGPESFNLMTLLYQICTNWNKGNLKYFEATKEDYKVKRACQNRIGKLKQQIKTEQHYLETIEASIKEKEACPINQLDQLLKEIENLKDNIPDNDANDAMETTD